MASSRDKDDPTDFDTVSGMADRLKLRGRDRQKYIHDHMTGLGYRHVPSYVKDDDDDDSSSFFGSRRRSRSRRDDDDDDGYPF